ncbi:MAG: hypothetical protein L6420_04165 [Elusimicrobia bacterium]|nr:hypothetical protein [Elusimicrobiota bacterium]
MPEDKLCGMVQSMYGLIDQHKIIDWHRNIEVERRVRMELEDYAFDIVRAQFGIPLSVDEIDNIISLLWNLAVENK